MQSSVELNMEMQKELNKRLYLISKILTIIGGVGAFVMCIIYVMLEKEYTIVDVLIYAFAIMLGVGVAFLSIVKKANKTVNDKKRVINYNFEETFMNLVVFNNGEQESISKIYYKDIVKVKYTQNYIFLYNTPTNALPVVKKSLSLEELKTLTDWISKERSLKKSK